MGAAMDRNAETTQPLGIFLALVTERIELGRMDISRRQARE